MTILRRTTKCADAFSTTLAGCDRLRSPSSITTLRDLLPSPEPALALDRAYLATVREQSFVRGRDTLIDALRNVIETAPANERTGVVVAIQYR